MGRRGPKTEPTALKLERGNPGHRPLNHDEPDLAAAQLKPTTTLKGVAKKEFLRLGPELISKGVLTIGDMVAFETYCQLVSDVREYEKLVRKVGHAGSVQLGYASQLFKARGQLKQYAAELGLTPSSRSGVKAVKTKEVVDEKKKRFFGGSRSSSA